MKVNIKYIISVVVFLLLFVAIFLPVYFFTIKKKEVIEEPKIEPIPYWQNIIWHNQKGCHESIYRQILAGLTHANYNKILLSVPDLDKVTCELSAWGIPWKRDY